MDGSIYLLDLVRFKPKRGGGHVERGLVLPTDNVYNFSLPATTFVIMHTDGAALTRQQDADDVALLDRSCLYPGQVVGSASDPGGQIGVVTGVAPALDLVPLGGAGQPAVRGASPDAVRRVRELSLGDFVVAGTWLGRVVEVSLTVDVRFDDGAVCRVTDADSKLLPMPWRAHDERRPQTNTPFCPGERVGGEPWAVYRRSRWLNGHWKPSRALGTVANVEMAGVLVYWVASPHCGTAPPAYQSPGNLTFFCSAPDSTWVVADRCFLRAPPVRSACDEDASSACDGEEEEDDARSACDEDEEDDASSACDEEPCSAPPKATASLRKHVFVRHRRRLREHGTRRTPPPMVVSNIRTAVDVLWQDGTRQLAAPSASLVPFEIINDHDFFPGQCVVYRNGDAGVVRSLNAKDRTVRVSWFKGGDDTVVSAYDLAWDSAQYAFYGDIVVRHKTPAEAAQPPKKQAAADLSWVGRVVDLPHGRVQVNWGDGTTSTVFPQEISVVNTDHYADLQAEMGDWMEDDVHEPTQELGAADMDNDSLNPQDAGNVVENANDLPNEDGPPAPAIRTGWLVAVFQSLIQLARQVLAGGKSYWTVNWWSSLPSSELPVAVANVEVPVLVSTSDEDHSNAGGTQQASGAGDGSREKEEGDTSVQKEEEDNDASGDDDSFHFPCFDVTQSPADHHYLDTKDEGGSGGKSWVKRVQREWKMLENDLPESIYVRAFEDRMDLVRAAMVGASGTPYHDGLFFFDLQLPPSYPAAPPQAYYHSFGLRLNPNLYASGTVCLSLLNTFGGEGSEVWSPAASSLLQVVVSLQGLVLNGEPYYNEAGYDALVGTPEGRRNALPYAENAYLLTLRTALHLLRRPPRGFEGFVADHFRRRGSFVLRACQAYLQGCAVGTLTADADDGRTCSEGFRLALAALVPSLEAAFGAIQAPLAGAHQ